LEAKIVTDSRVPTTIAPSFPLLLPQKILNSRIVKRELLNGEFSYFGTIVYDEESAPKTLFVKCVGEREKRILRIVNGISSCISTIGEFAMTTAARENMKIGSHWVAFPYVEGSETLAHWKEKKGKKNMSFS
jgi:hypothetical protein